jgi:phytoene dehydrogenase-like protein
LKSTLATDAVIGAMTSPSTPGSGYVLFHHVMGEVDGRKGAWAYVEGGMGAVSNSLAASAHSVGVETYCNAEVQEILIENNTAAGVILTNGQVIRSKLVASNATPQVTFLRLINRNQIPHQYRRNIEHLDTTSPVTKINLAMDKLPNFRCIPNQSDHTAGPQHVGTIHFVENCEQIESGYRDAIGGLPSRRPVIEMTIPSSLDPTLAPAGKHVASLFVQYTPYNIPGGWSKGARADFAATCFDLIEEYCPGFKNSLLHYEVLTPPDLERIFGLTGGNIFHSSMGLDQLFWLRPVAQWAQHRTPINNLYLCGSGTHPGGGVMGSAGKNASQIMKWDFKAQYEK